MQTFQKIDPLAMTSVILFVSRTSNAIKPALAMERQVGLMRKKIAMRNPGRKPGTPRKPGRKPGGNPGKILMNGEIQIGMILGRNMGRNRKFNRLPCLLLE